MRLGALLGLVLCVLIQLVIPATAQAIGVQPLVIDLDVDPGDMKEFFLDLNAANKEEAVILSLYQPLQNETGELAYRKASPSVFPAMQWVRLEQQSLRMLPDERKRIKGEVSVPLTARGSHTVVIMVESSAPDSGTTGITVRYAVRVNIRVYRADQKADATLLEAGLIAGPKGVATLSALVQNGSQLDYPAGIEAVVRDSQRRVVERAYLLTDAARKAARVETRIYPGAKVRFYTPLSRPLPPGTYEIRFFLRYAERGQRVAAQQASVQEGQYAMPAGMTPYAAVTPASLSEELKAGGLVTVPIEVQNLHKGPVSVRVAAVDIEPGYQHGLTKWLRVRGQTEFGLRSLERRKVPITIQPEVGAVAGGYYATVIVEVFVDGGSDPVSTSSVEVSARVGKELVHKAEPVSVSYLATEEGLNFSVDTANRGNVHIAPVGRLVLRDANSQTVAQLSLQMEEGVSRILPLQAQRLTGLLDKAVAPGAYRAEVEVEEGGQVIGQATFQMDIADFR